MIDQRLHFVARFAIIILMSSFSMINDITPPPSEGNMSSFRQRLSTRLTRLLLRPSLWVAIISIIAYWDNAALHGKWVYDDSGSVAKNVVVIGQVPWKEAFLRDFWGTSMKEVTSHKSFRPITTLSFKLNHIFNEHVLNVDGLETYSYKLVNLLAHATVSCLVTEASVFIFHGEDFHNQIAQIITGLLFALHPVHAEAVSNVTSRGEMLMSFFFLVAFLSFATHLPTSGKRYSTLRSGIGIYIIPWLGMTLSLFSKEQGATTLISLVIYDFMSNHESLHHYYQELIVERRPEAVAFLRRTLILALQTVVMAAYRYWLNGETSPDFIFDQNPAGFSEERFTRVFSVTWVYCLYIHDAVFPKYLCCDWSGRSITLIEDPDDERIWLVLLLWAFAAATLVSLVLGPPEGSSDLNRECRRIIIMAFWGFCFAPFLLSSNILVVTGLMKADRVIYLPLLGFCLMEALLLKALFIATETKQDNNETGQDTDGAATRRTSYTSLRTTGYLFFLIQMLLLTSKLHERNIAWSDSLNLWLSAYDINKRSHHTMYNCGYELSIKKRFREAEQVMRPIGNPRVDGPSNTVRTFVRTFSIRSNIPSHPPDHTQHTVCVCNGSIQSTTV
jgi:hypothetical protein